MASEATLIAQGQLDHALQIDGVDEVGRLRQAFERMRISLKARLDAHDISASEAASRLGLHIRTAQDFLEAMESLGILSKEEVYEKKRPYYRYTLARSRITIDIDLAGMVEDESGTGAGGAIREMKNSGAMFTTARGGNRISSVTVWTGEGRGKKERRISLTNAQGSFLFHLPFPNAAPMNIAAIMEKAGIDEIYLPEIKDLVDLLVESGVIEVHDRS